MTHIKFPEYIFPRWGKGRSADDQSTASCRSLDRRPPVVRVAVMVSVSLVFLGSLAADAVSPGRWEFADRNSFGHARVEGLEISPEGRLRPGVVARGRRINADYVWSILEVGNFVYVGVGDGARILRFPAQGGADPLAIQSSDESSDEVATPASDAVAGGEASEGEAADVVAEGDGATAGTASAGGDIAWAGRGLEVYTLAQDDAGRIIAGVSPVGQVHIFEPRPEGLVLVETIQVPDSYVWRVLPVGDALWIATGSGNPARGGGVYRWYKNRLRRFYRGADPHVLCLARSGDAIYAGTQGQEGLILKFADIFGSRISATVAFDPPQNEILDLAVAPDGTVYAAATTAAARRNGSGPRLAGSRVTSAPPEPPASGEGDGEEGGGEGEEEPSASSSPSPPSPSAIYRLTSDGRAEEWIRSRSSVRSLLFRDGQLYAGTTENGNVYRIDGPSRSSLIVDLDEKSVLSQAGQWIGTTGPARLYHLEPAADSAWCRTEVLDADGLANWGVVTFEAQGSWEVRTRSGNAEKPNATWSAWSDPARVSGEQISSSPARFLQVEMRRVSHDADDYLRAPAITYQAINRSPRLFGVAVAPLSTDQRSLARLGRAGPMGQLILQLSQAARNMANQAAGRGSPSMEEILQPFLGFMQVGWTADDPDGDKLTVGISVSDEDGGRVVNVADDVRGDLYLLNTRNFPDGRYRVQVTVTDTTDNNPGEGLKVQLASEVFLIDNTAPLVILRMSEDGITGRAVDGGGRIAALYVLDADNRWQPLLPVDGICDQSEETFRIAAPPLADRHRTVVVKAVDQSGNIGFGRMAN